MNAFNGVCTTLMGFVVWIFAWLNPTTLLACCAVVTGLIAAWVYRQTSNQQAIRRVADLSRAELLAIGLFKDDLKIALTSHLSLLRLSALRIWYATPAVLILILPFVLVLVQLGTLYQHRPLAPGESAIVSVEFSPAVSESLPSIELDAPANIEVETPPLRDAQKRQVHWRIRPRGATTDSLRFELPDQTVVKHIVAMDLSNSLQIVSPRRASANIIDRFFHPTEPGFSAEDPIQAIQLDCPRRATTLMGWEVPWWLVFCVVSIASSMVAGHHWLKTEF